MGKPQELVQLPAGDFTTWLRATETSLESGKGTIDMPCGNCTACCHSSMFIHIAPGEKRTLGRIPRRLLFPAPGWPKGHLLMGYDENGRCPMLIDDRCSIYEDRPQTCRTYDCRIFAATGIPLDESTQADIAARVKAWVFDYQGDAGYREHNLLQMAARFIQNNRDLFPPNAIPAQSAQIAVLAVRIYRVFAEIAPPVHTLPDTEIARAILGVLNA